MLLFLLGLFKVDDTCIMPSWRLVVYVVTLNLLHSHDSVGVLVLFGVGVGLLSC